MKKLIIIVALMTLGIQAYASETSSQATNKKENRTQVHPENYSHWSLSLGAGANLMIGDRERMYDVKNYRTYLQNNTNWGLNLQVDYMINPIWGIKFQYLYTQQRKDARNAFNDFYQPESSIATDRNLNMHETEFQVVLNMLNLVRRTRTHTDWNFYVAIGAGVLTYEKCYDGVYNYAPAWMFPASMSVEYNPLPELGIYAEGLFRWYASDRVNGIEDGQMKDIGLYGGIGLRYHIKTNGKPHVSSIDMNTYEPLRVQSQKSEEDIAEDLQGKIDFLTDQINNMNNSIASLEQTRKQVSDNTDSINNLRTQVDAMEVGGQNVYVSNNNLYQYNSEDNSIYFDLNSAEVKSMYYAEVVKIARRMQNDYKLKLKITGYCDSEGSVDYNKELAQKRINAITYLLVNRFRISRDRFITNNAGMVSGENEVNELNRRVDIEYMY